MKKHILIYFLLSIPLLTFAQPSAKTTTFDINWSDGSTSTILFTDSIKYFSIKSDASIEFNAKQEQDGIYLNPSLTKASCENDTTAFFAASSELFLGKDENDACYQLEYSGHFNLLFRNAKKPLLKGVLNYGVFQAFYCPIFINNACIGGLTGYELIHFNSYTLNSDNIKVPINEKIVTGLQENKKIASNSVSPNPFSSTIQVQSNQFDTFLLSSINGRVIKNNLPTNQVVDLSDLENGVYIAQLGNVTFKRIIKQ